MYLKIALTVLVLLGSHLVFAEKSDRDKPLNIEAERCEFDQKTMISICTGHVIVRQGTMTIQSDKLRVRQDAEGHYFAQGEGQPVKFKQRMDNKTDWLEAESNRFDYDGKKGFLQLLDEAWVSQGANKVKGEIITYDLNTGRYEAMGKPGERVNITLIPNKKTEKTAP